MRSKVLMHPTAARCLLAISRAFFFHFSKIRWKRAHIWIRERTTCEKMRLKQPKNGGITLKIYIRTCIHRLQQTLIWLRSIIMWLMSSFSFSVCAWNEVDTNYAAYQTRCTIQILVQMSACIRLWARKKNRIFFL